MTFIFAVVLGVVFAVDVNSAANECICESGTISSLIVCSIIDSDDQCTVKEDQCSKRISAALLHIPHLGSVSSSAIPNITLFRIRITGNIYMIQVDDDTFAGHEDTLRYLEITKGSLFHVPSAIRRLRHLVSLNLASNYITSIDCSIENIPLKQLILRDNNMNKTDRCSFPLSLHDLSLDGNRFWALQGSLKNHSQLERVFMRDNMLTSLEGELEGLDSLSWLDASWNKIETIGKEPVKLHGLHHLDLSHNYISELGNSLKWFSNLHYLDLSNNNIETLGVDVFSNLKNLRHLSLSENNLQYLDDKLFSSQEKLQTLVISKNVILSLDEKLRGMYSLRKLDASWNHLRHFRTAIEPLSYIEEINLSNNRIVDFGTSEYELVFSHLVKLDLSFNDLSIIRPDAFNTFLYLQELNLAANKFISLNGSMFTSLPNLRRLDLSFTGLLSLENLMTPGFMGMKTGSTSESIAEGWIEGKCVCRPRDVIKLLRIEGNILACYTDYTDFVTKMDQHNIEVTGC